MREQLRCGSLHLKTTASCAMLFRDVTAMLMADEADDGPLALRARKVENTVGGLGKTLEESPERRA